MVRLHGMGMAYLLWIRKYLLLDILYYIHVLVG